MTRATSTSSRPSRPSPTRARAPTTRFEPLSSRSMSTPLAASSSRTTSSSSPSSARDAPAAARPRLSAWTFPSLATASAPPAARETTNRVTAAAPRAPQILSSRDPRPVPLTPSTTKSAPSLRATSTRSSPVTQTLARVFPSPLTRSRSLTRPAMVSFSPSSSTTRSRILSIPVF